MFRAHQQQLAVTPLGALRVTAPWLVGSTQRWDVHVAGDELKMEPPLDGAEGAHTGQNRFINRLLRKVT